MTPDNAHIFTHLSAWAERKHREARRAQAMQVRQQADALLRFLRVLARRPKRGRTQPGRS